MKTFKEFLTEDFKTGDYVTWHYRSGSGHGRIAEIAKKADTSAKTKYKIKEFDHHEGESKYVYHYGSALTHYTGKFK